MNLDDALPGFIAECADLLREMETGLLDCACGAHDAETINSIFRVAHTIKGSAGLFGLDAIVEFVHVVETALDAVRLGRVSMTEELVALLLRCKDHIESLVGRITGADGADDPLLDARGVEILAALKQATGAKESGKVQMGSGGATPAASPEKTEDWRICVRFGPDVLTSGMDPLGFIRYLKTFGEILAVAVLEEALPPPPDMQPEICYLGFEIDFRTAADQARIEAAFEFVREDCTLTVSAGAPSVTVAPTAARDSTSDSSPRKQLSAEGGAAAATVRVDAAKLDYLITRIGELIIAAAGANLLARRAGNTELEESTSTLSGLVEQVREGALQLRMVKIGGTFSRFQRTVHDVSRELGKEIRLVIRGEDTELDKTVVERIADPLTHLVRNAIDHGIEPAEVRIARGKPAAGTVTLNAYHDSGSIVIEVSDDGGGLKREKILSKALERGLAEADRPFTDSEVFGFVFEAGFSTAERVTNLSGRGVGMDVVKRNITALRGTVGIRSAEGSGTTVTVRLPLTLAIINGFQVAVGKSSFVLPLDTIEECVEFSAEDGHDFANLRGGLLPFVRLREIFGTSEPAARRQSIVVVKHAGERAGLVVDALLGEFQTVIKPLGKLFRNVDCVSGSSILGNGDVALILDVPALVQQATAGVQRRAAGALGIQIGE
ncbi:MAG: CheA signal transduction histidine kinase [Gammaproteobacteria bacterium]|nr:CheA signal transduction histidine kinase [Gammaproteobacteria bacterium]